MFLTDPCVHVKALYVVREKRCLVLALLLAYLFSFGNKVATIPKSEEFHISELETLDRVQSV